MLTGGPSLDVAQVANSAVEMRRLLSEQEGESQRQCDTLSRAIHSLADTLNLSSPLITAGAGGGSPQHMAMH